ncbi:LysR family transcriptional regulator [Bordetella ansorpii]|uniref:LysR family transcriptional regulator n=1 Tax=Bordetella ansorpii TaxID=288768 RepID=A0A157SI71_9BORD|nr:LysR substrate-binding domain-containing protein [Bordetella ansorpii]SAI70115.1 LysR family transcriptional regulator [Bordetella ansorpii]
MPSPSPWYLRSRLKPRQLLLLVTLADEGNIHRAAEVLNMTQPGASKLLKELEDMLGVPLFERLPRGVRPTWYGDVMLRHARTALGSLEQAHEELAALRDGRIGQVAVGAITSPGITLLPRVVAELKAERPDLRIALEIESSDVLLEHLAQGRLDILVARLFAKHDKSQLRYEPLVKEPVCAVARPGHPLCGGQALSLSGVRDATWIVPPAGSVLRHRFELMFQERGLPVPGNLVETAALLFITRMLRDSDMLAVLALDVARYYAAHGVVRILPLEMPCHMDDFGLITRRDRPASPATRVTLQALRRCAADVYGVAVDAE